ncbi:MAG: hypothetical protein EP349_06190 [Alphaproteobacteria bacterium]|nr:MAG: hypothetical protein EP349_06190 [Alphaproteobacteria bacterium]
MAKHLKDYVSEVDLLLQSFHEVSNASSAVMAERKKFVVTKEPPSEEGLEAAKRRQNRLDALRRKAGR